MKLDIDIRDDKELRDQIRDMIRGQVNALIRAEFEAMLKDAIGNRVEKLSDIMAKEIAKVVKEFFQGTYMTKGPGYEMIEKEIKEQVAAALKKVIQESL